MIIKRLLKMSLIPVSVLCVSAVMLSISIYGYSRLSNETLIAEITFDKLVNNAHIAHVTTVDHCQTVDYHPIYGDQWRIDARFLKWKPWANLMGLDSNYRLDRLEGRSRRSVAIRWLWLFHQPPMPPIARPPRGWRPPRGRASSPTTASPLLSAQLLDVV